VIILDTNIVSALMAKEPPAAVVRWLDRCPPESIWTTSITIYELRLGIERLAGGRRRRELEDQFAQVIRDDIQNRVLALDTHSAHEAATLSAQRQSRGMPAEIRDTMIAGIALAHRADFATGNMRHFQDIDIRLIDPWSA